MDAQPGSLITITYNTGAGISKGDLEKHHKALANHLLIKTHRYRNAKDLEVYTDYNSCIVDIKEHKNGSADILQIKIVGTREKAKDIKKSLDLQTEGFYWMREAFSKYNSDELKSKTYVVTEESRKWYNGLAKALLKELSKSKHPLQDFINREY